jgi:hypothetical protein
MNIIEAEIIVIDSHNFPSDNVKSEGENIWHIAVMASLMLFALNRTHAKFIIKIVMAMRNAFFHECHSFLLSPQALSIHCTTP